MKTIPIIKGTLCEIYKYLEEIGEKAEQDMEQNDMFLFDMATHSNDYKNLDCIEIDDSSIFIGAGYGEERAVVVLNTMQLDYLRLASEKHYNGVKQWRFSYTSDFTLHSDVVEKVKSIHLDFLYLYNFVSYHGFYGRGQFASEALDSNVLRRIEERVKDSEYYPLYCALCCVKGIEFDESKYPSKYVGIYNYSEINGFFQDTVRG